ncbi:hypothetical protein HNY73_005609 [Argiope bruennichi]|uniref:Uncharacterized protein n=1 Tax=Argiope bruennichi TaxID=94029 RepID=A0A8T0FH65_ARGBR|nr:hypothetical protein HNY73_005609 [Argiope bruennichi]
MDYFHHDAKVHCVEKFIDIFFVDLEIHLKFKLLHRNNRQQKTSFNLESIIHQQSPFIPSRIFDTTTSKDANSNILHQPDNKLRRFSKEGAEREKTHFYQEYAIHQGSIHLFAYPSVSLWPGYSCRQQEKSEVVHRHGLTATPISSGLPGERSGMPPFPPSPFLDNPGEKAYPQCLLPPLQNHRFEKKPHTATADLCSSHLDGDTVQRILIT